MFSICGYVLSLLLAVSLYLLGQREHGDVNCMFLFYEAVLILPALLMVMTWSVIVVVPKQQQQSEPHEDLPDVDTPLPRWRKHKPIGYFRKRRRNYIIYVRRPHSEWWNVQYETSLAVGGNPGRGFGDVVSQKSN